MSVDQEEARTAQVRALPLYTVDAFTDRPFSGNPAAICLDASKQGLSPELMQKIAAEMNISETAFIKTLRDEDTFENSSVFGLRWFTPVTEVPLCGHATLASATTLIIGRGNTSSVITFQTASGDLLVRRDGPSAIGMDLPLNTPSPAERQEFKDLIQAVVGELEVTDVQYSSTTRKLLIRLDDGLTRECLEGLGPDTSRFTQISSDGKVKGVIVTLKGSTTTTNLDGQHYDFVSRYFAPWAGIPEDPVTGSAHTVLAGYWTTVLDKTNFFARQCSARGGELRIQVEGTDRVTISGQATMVVQGHINLPL